MNFENQKTKRKKFTAVFADSFIINSGGIQSSKVINIGNNLNNIIIHSFYSFGQLYDSTNINLITNYNGSTVWYYSDNSPINDFIPGLNNSNYNNIAYDFNNYKTGILDININISTGKNLINRTEFTLTSSATSSISCYYTHYLVYSFIE